MAKIRRGNPHKDQMDDEISRLDKLAQTSPFRTWKGKGISKWHKQHKQASAMWKKHMRQKVKP